MERAEAEKNARGHQMSDDLRGRGSCTGSDVSKCQAFNCTEHQIQIDVHKRFGLKDGK